MLIASLSYRTQHEVDEYSLNLSHYAPHHLTCVLHLDGRGDSVTNGLNFEGAAYICSAMFTTFSIISGIALTIGVPGNVMAAITALSMDRMPSSRYLFFLAVGDLFTVLARAGTPVTTKLNFELFKFSCGFFSNYTLMMICFERFMAVCFPWLKKHFFTARVASGTAVLFVVVYVLMLRGLTGLANYTQIRMSSLHLINATFVFGVPGVFIAVFNTITVRRLRQMRQVSKGHKFWTKVEESITYMMIVASVIFLVLNGPTFVMCFVWFLLDHSEWRLGRRIDQNVPFNFILNLAYWLTLLHHSVNFYLYILGTQRFRQQCFIVLYRLRSDVYAVSSIMSTSVTHTIKSSTNSRAVSWTSKSHTRDEISQNVVISSLKSPSVSQTP